MSGFGQRGTSPIKGLPEPQVDEVADVKSGYRPYQGSDMGYGQNGAVQVNKNNTQDKVAKEMERKRRSILIYGCEDMRSVIV